MEILEYNFPKGTLTTYVQLKAYYIQLTISFSSSQQNIPTSPEVFHKQQAVCNKTQCPF